MKSKSNFFFNNWQLILCFSWLAAIGSFTIYSIVTEDEDLSNGKLRYELAEQLAKEMKELPSPPRTAVNNFQSNARDRKILVQTRYRTELSEKEIIEYFTRELEKRNWIYKNEQQNDLVFCRGKQSASIAREKSGGIVGSRVNYFSLVFSKGLGNCD